MPYDDDVDDLFGEEFDFVDDDDDETSTDDSKLEAEEKPAPKGRKPAPSRGKPAPTPRPRGKAPAAGGSREAREPREARDSRDRDRDRDEAPAPPAETASEFGDRPPVDEPDDAPLPPTTAPADHCVHIYQYGKLSRTIPRKFTDEEAVSFAEEYTRTGKAYGRYAIATPDDEEPAEEFADAAKG